MNTFLSIIIIGAGATLATDIWGWLRLKALGVAAPNFGLVGRWLAYIPKGRFIHTPISKSPAIRGENVIGWSAHYLIGIAFAMALVLVWGTDWIQSPSFLPALIVGAVTVLAPFLLMQPGMGSGVAARKTPNPNKARFHSLLTHIVFGLGLYVTAHLNLFLFS